MYKNECQGSSKLESLALVGRGSNQSTGAEGKKVCERQMMMPCRNRITNLSEILKSGLQKNQHYNSLF